jgi:hypothetical protein
MPADEMIRKHLPFAAFGPPPYMSANGLVACCPSLVSFEPEGRSCHMVVRPPQQLSRPSSRETALDILGYELRAEQASSLGHAGRKVEAVLAALRACERGSEAREALIMDAAEIVYAYFIQRELVGLRNTAQTIRDYAIPPEVIARLGCKR